MVFLNKRTLVFMICAAVVGAVQVAATGRGPQQSLTFVLTIERCGSDLGTFSKVTGLDASFDVADYRSNDHANVYRWFYPGAGPRGTLTLSRQSAGDSEAVERCLRELAASGEPADATITLFNSGGQPVAVWDLEAAFPQKWTVPAGDAEGSVGIETLVLAHEGLVVRSCTDCLR